MTNKDKSNMETDKNNETVKTSTLGVVMDWVATLGIFVVAIFGFASGNFLSGIGWCLAGISWIIATWENDWTETIIEMYREHLNECEKRDEAYKAKIKEYEDKLNKVKNEEDK